MKKNPNRIEFTVEDDFKTKVRALSARWGVKSNVAVQRSVDQAMARKLSDSDKAVLDRVEEKVDAILSRLFD